MEDIDRRAMAYAIVECGLCDDDGYRGPIVCDHIDRTETHRRGMTKVRAVLAKSGQRALGKGVDA